MAVPRPLVLAWVIIGAANILLLVTTLLVGFSAPTQPLDTGEAVALSSPGLATVSTVLSSLWGIVLVYFLGVMRSDVKSITSRLVDALRNKSSELQASSDESRALVAGNMGRAAVELANAVRMPSPWGLPVLAGVLLLTAIGASVYIAFLSQQVPPANPLEAIETLFLIATLGLISSTVAFIYLVVVLYALSSLNWYLGNIDLAMSSSFEALSNLVAVEEGVKGRKLGRRSAALYVILTLITLSFFMLYWLWALNGDLAKCERRADSLLTLLSRT